MSLSSGGTTHLAYLLVVQDSPLDRALTTEALNTVAFARQALDGALSGADDRRM